MEGRRGLAATRRRLGGETSATLRGLQHTMNTRKLPPAVAIVVAALCAIFASPREAAATREYAKAEGKDCAYCHISEKGSGPRTPKGREYEANGHKFGVKSWSSDANEQKYLRASSAVVAQWYAEAVRNLDELANDEKLPGGCALVEGTRERFKMFKRSWLGAAKKLIATGDRGMPNALVFLTKLESQYAATDEGKEAVATLDKLAADAKWKDAVARARAVEKARQLLLEGRTEFQLGHADKAREVLTKALADANAQSFEQDVKETLAALPAVK
jgi:hypothetical protein